MSSAWPPQSVCNCDNPLLCPHLTFIQVRLIEVVRSRDVHVIQAGDIPVSSEVLQQLDFTQRSLRQDLLGEYIGHLLDCDTLAGLVVGGCADDTVRALSQLFGNRVALVHYEVLIKDLEDLAALQRWVAHADRLGSARVDSWTVNLERVSDFVLDVLTERCALPTMIFHDRILTRGPRDDEGHAIGGLQGLALELALELELAEPVRRSSTLQMSRLWS